MNIEEAISLFHRIEGEKLSKDLTLGISPWNRDVSVKFSIHAEKKSLSKIMAMIVKETGVELSKELISNWQCASGCIGNTYFKFFPRAGAFVKCKVVKKTRKITVPAQPAVEEHEEKEVYYETVCKNGENDK